jgi:hypothetical protein
MRLVVPEQTAVPRGLIGDERREGEKAREEPEPIVDDRRLGDLRSRRAGRA